jgi:hypothetical protein
VIGVALFVVASTVFLRAAQTVPFHGDESEWISAGRYFKFIFLDHDVSSTVWRPSWLNRDQPPIGRYVIGAITWATGTNPSQLNRTYDWDKDYDANLQEGRVPGPNLLGPVRRTMAMIGALAVVVLFVVGRLIGGSLAGAGAGLFATFSPLLQTYFVQARTEALLAFLSIVALLGTLLVARRFQSNGSIPRFGWGVGLVLGLALATKLTAALAIVGVCAYGGMAALSVLRRARGVALRMFAWTFATGALATVVWVAVNPFLWPDPAGRTLSMLEQQQSIMVEQGVQFGNPVDGGFVSRVGLLVYRTFVETSTPAFDAGLPRGSEPVIGPTFFGLWPLLGVSIALALAAVGLAVLVRQATLAWRVNPRHGPEIALLWWLAAYMLGIAANLSLDWPRYYVPSAFFGSLLIGLGVSRVVAFSRQAMAGRLSAVRPAAERPIRAAG